MSWPVIAWQFNDYGLTIIRQIGKIFYTFVKQSPDVDGELCNSVFCVQVPHLVVGRPQSTGLVLQRVHFYRVNQQHHLLGFLHSKLSDTPSPHHQERQNHGGQGLLYHCGLNVHH